MEESSLHSSEQSTTDPIEDFLREIENEIDDDDIKEESKFKHIQQPAKIVVSSQIVLKKESSKITEVSDELLDNTFD